MPTAFTSKSRKRDRRRAVMRRLGRSVNDEVGLQFFHQRQHRFPIPDIDRAVPVTGNLLLQPPSTQLVSPSGPKKTAR